MKLNLLVIDNKDECHSNTYSSFYQNLTIFYIFILILLKKLTICKLNEHYYDFLFVHNS